MIDLWTTRCTRCPAALDTLNQFADDVSGIATSNIQCISICCGDRLDGAREIIEATKMPRWGAVQHYFMSYNDKERLKQLLNFRQVPFYVVFHCSGALLYAGHQKKDWQKLFEEHLKQRNPTGLLDAKTVDAPGICIHSPTSSILPLVPASHNQHHDIEIPAFVIHEMDF